MINQVTIKGSSNNSINGIYIVSTLRNVDKDTKSYYKDDQHQLYRYNNKWRIAITKFLSILFKKVLLLCIT